MSQVDINVFCLLIALTTLVARKLKPNVPLLAQRLALGYLLTLIVACGHKRVPDICNTEMDTQMITYPDHVTRKSDIQRCHSPSTGLAYTRVLFVNNSNVHFDVFGSEPEGYQPPSL